MGTAVRGVRRGDEVVDPSDQQNGADAAASARYRDLVYLGRGGMGEVHLSVSAGPIGTQKLLVRKRLRPSLSDDPDVLKMFLDEARLAVRLHHPNVVQSYEVGFDGDRHFIAMEYLEGDSLHTILQRHNERASRLPLPMHIRILIEALAGLHYAHELHDLDGVSFGVVHRDATPSNIFVTYDGTVKVVDFGIAKVAGSDTSTGVIKGKLAYVAPEQVAGRNIDRRADIFTIGVLLFEAIANRRLWAGTTEVEILRRLDCGEVPSLRVIAPNAPSDLIAIVDKALAPRPDDRFASAALMAAALERYLATLGDRTSARDVGVYVAEVFAQERLRTRSTIESALRRLRAEDAGGTAPDPRPHRIDPPTAVASAIEPRPTRDESLTHSGAQSLQTRAATSLPPRGREQRLAIAVGGALLVVFGVGASWVSARRSAGTRMNSQPPSIAAPAPIAPEVSAASMVLAPSPPLTAINLNLVPADAHVLIDDVPVVSTVHPLRVPRDGVAHRVRVEAVGYLPRAEWVAFDQSEVTVTETLDRATTPVSATASSASSTRSAPKRPTSATLDMTDPWKK